MTIHKQLEVSGRAAQRYLGLATAATLGKFTATLTADGDLRVACPKGRAVIVTTM